MAPKVSFNVPSCSPKFALSVKVTKIQIIFSFLAFPRRKRKPKLSCKIVCFFEDIMRMKLSFEYW